MYNKHNLEPVQVVRSAGCGAYFRMFAFCGRETLWEHICRSNWADVSLFATPSDSFSRIAKCDPGTCGECLSLHNRGASASASGAAPAEGAAPGQGVDSNPGTGAEVRARCRMAVLMQRCLDTVHRRCGAQMPPQTQLRLLAVLQARPFLAVIF